MRRTAAAAGVRIAIGVLAVMAALAPSARAYENPPRANLSYVIVGGESSYAVQRGDSLKLIGARFGVSPWVISSINMIDPNASLRIGQRLRIDNRHIVPAVIADGILVNIPQRMMFLFSDGDLLNSYPVAVGRPDVKWRTPAAMFKVLALDENPVWLVPESIQEEMEEEGKEVETRIAAGPDNPLGGYRIKLSIPGYAIHSTIAPAGVYSFQTHGCVRLMPSDAEAFFGRMRIGIRGRIIYQPAMMALLPDGRIFAEINPDVYKMAGDPIYTLHAIADSHKLGNMIDWNAARTVADRHQGVAREITAGAAKP
jgi:L,D-transpeptidase ErfK/SrfK